MNKKIFVAVLMVLAFAMLLWAAQATVTATREAYGDMSVYKFTFTDGGTDTAICVPSGANYFNMDAYNDLNASYYFSSAETTLDSIRWEILRQAKDKPTGTWFTVETIGTAQAASSLDSSLTGIGTFDYDTYGRWPIERILLIGSAAQNSEQTVTGYVAFNKD